MTIRALVLVSQLSQPRRRTARWRQSASPKSRTGRPLTEVPTWQLALMGGFGGIWTAFLVWALGTVVPEYFALTSRGVPFDRTAGVLTIQLLLAGSALWCASEVMSVCRAEVRRRLFS